MSALHVLTDKASGIEELRVIKYADDHFEAKWKKDGRTFSMFFDPLMKRAKGDRIEWGYADRSSDRKGSWQVSFNYARNMVPSVFRLIEQANLCRQAAEDHLREVMSPERQDHRRKARTALALEMYSALQTIQRLAHFGRPKGEAFGLNERERLEILLAATTAVTAVDTWTEEASR